MRWTALLLLGLGSCASPGHKMVMVDTSATRDAPPTVEYLENRLRLRSTAVLQCYKTESLNSKELSSYRFRVEVPNDGTNFRARTRASIPEQTLLRSCVEDALLGNQRFRAYRTEDGLVTVDYTVEPPSEAQLAEMTHYSKNTGVRALAGQSATEKQRARKVAACQDLCTTHMFARQNGGMMQRPQRDEKYYACVDQCVATAGMPAGYEPPR